MALAHRDGSFDLSVLDVVPDPLVWVQVGRVRGKEEETEPARRAGYVFLDDLRCMRAAAIDDEEHRSGAVVQKSFAELNESGGGHTSLEEVEVQLSPSADRRDHVDGLTLAGRLDDRRLSDRSPRRSGVMICPYARFILKKDSCAGLLGCLADLRERLLLPDSHLVRVPLVRPVQRLLGRQAEFLEDPADRHQGQTVLEFTADELGHKLACPQGEVELVLPGILAYDH